MSLEQKLKVNVDGDDYELTMWFGLLNKILRVVSSDTDALQAVFSNEARDSILKLVLRKRGKSGVYETDFEIDDVDICSEDVVAIQVWVAAHVADFFLLAAEKTKALGETLENRSQALMPSQPGTGS